MKGIWKDIITAVFWGMLMPGVLLNYGVLYMDRQVPPKENAEEQVLSVRLLQIDGTVTEQDLEGYLTQVLLAEIPASFEEEALKAQAVAARTYAWKAYTTGEKHENGCVCTDPACCQASITEETYLSKGGTQEGIEKIRAAVYATAGSVLTYEEELIDATYFSCSGGSTEAAVAVWGTDVPYLQSVPSPNENAKYDSDTVSFSLEQFCNALGKELNGDPQSWFRNVTYTEGGGVACMSIGGQDYSGTQLRKMLGLRSTVFSIASDKELITITTRGYGHRVGLSQYGANAMAKAGSNYEEILAHYYPGTQLQKVVG